MANPLHAPYLQKLSSIEQERFVVEICLLTFGILDCEQGDFWREVRSLSHRNQNALLDAIAMFLVGTATEYECYLVSEFAFWNNLHRQAIEDYAAPLREITQSYWKENSEIFAPFMELVDWHFGGF
ncbi:MAG: hypothetical protein LH702_02440 [Phormidesmis sp. CAN_BIN44]|nr:hypothetical protein [Phormidesmis sp. CAN_BIN44]